MSNDIILSSIDKHKYTLILLHGMYVSNKSLLKLSNKLIKTYKNLKIILPNAPKRVINWPHLVENNVRSWYNYFTCNDGAMKHDKIDTTHFHEEVERINKIIDEESEILNGLSSNIMIGGISQGGTLALHIGLMYNKKLACIIGIHTILMNNVTKISNECQKIPIYLFSGNKDNIYNIKLQNRSLNNIRKLKYRIFWHIENNLKHCEFCKKENKFIYDVIKKIVT